MKHVLHSLILFLCLPAWAEDFPDPIAPEDFLIFDPDQAKIGQLLFYDKVLSGNRNISCGTCHHHDLGGTDGLSLGIGEGGVGLGAERSAGTGTQAIQKRVPRNAPGLWNLGHREIHNVFHDGRLEIGEQYGNGFNSPAQEWLPQGLDNIIAAQALFPITAQFEMAGNPSENEIAGAVHDRIDVAWPILAKRVRTIPAYGQMFVDAFDNIETPDQVTIVEIGNALGAFIGSEWANYDSPYDRWLAGESMALRTDQMRGMIAFYGEAGCSTCHSGPLLSDQKFHALALPQFGPGRTRPFDPIARDVGRVGESDQAEDAYRFRTPLLRNVALTGPYGHNGAYPTLEGIIRHHLQPLESLDNWTRDMAKLRPAPWLAAGDFIVQSDKMEQDRLRAKLDIIPHDLDDKTVSDLVAFMNALTGASAQSRPLGRPDTVPSGLPVD